MLSILLRAAAFLFVAVAVPNVAFSQTNVLFIVDASGSMKKAVDGEPRMTAAKRVLADALARMPAETRLGLLVYGHRKAKDCTDIELVAPIGSEDASAIAGRIGTLTPRGETPIAAALQAAAKSFAVLKGQGNAIVLVTDGIEECKGDPCAAARAIKAAGLDLKVNVVGFTLKEEQEKLIHCVAEETGGDYYSAANASALTQALTAASQAAAAPAPQPAPAPEPDNNILASTNGGALVAAPHDQWLELNDGIEDAADTSGGEGVWSFKEGKPATFDAFEMLIPQADGNNVREFELFAGDEGPGGAFRSIGRYSTQNLKLLQSPYQKFSFAPVTARFLKVKILSHHGGGYAYAYEFRLHGTVDETAVAALPPAPAGIDLLAPANGGNLLGASRGNWTELTDGSNRAIDIGGGEGVWAFAGEKAAVIDRFEVLVPEAVNHNLNEFELLVAEDAPSGPFRSIGRFKTGNYKLYPSGYQAFTFAPVKARYFKLASLSHHGGGFIWAYEVRLFGELER
jgi:hypothetical protein